MSWLSNVGGLIIGCDWYEGMHRPDESGHIRPTGRITGGHCVFINEVLPGVTGVGGQNSWGLGWGVYGGFFFLYNDDLKFLINRPHFVAGALVQKEESKPKPPDPEPPKPDPDDPTPPKRPKVYYSKMDNLKPDRLKNEEFDGVTRKGEVLGTWRGVNVK